MTDYFPSLDFFGSTILLTFGALLALYQIGARNMLFFQQEEYDNPRFLSWWIRTASFEKRATTLSFIFILAIWLSEPYATITALPLHRDWLLATVIALSIAIAGLSNRGYHTKKPLRWTSRAERIFYTFILLQLLFVFGGTCLFLLTPYKDFHLLITTSLIALSLLLAPLMLVLANCILSPYEASVQRKFLKEAREKLARVKPHIIGITGSYGKTSIKHILAHVMASHAPTLSTPGSVNTLMGITRIIRENLRNDHAFFIVEMGAYGIGSIRRLCDLTPPGTAIVTAIGLAHMERFKTVENVLQAKSELPQSLPPDGIAILNGDDPNLRCMAEGLSITVLFYGSNPRLGVLHCTLKEAKNTQSGTFCVVEYEGKTYSIDLPLFGRHQALNASGAFLTAMQFGMAPITAIAAMQSIPQIPHRLVVQRRDNGVTIIDDAYNSNPTGFETAMDVVNTLDGKRKILVTPGMVELGTEAQNAHRQVSIRAAEVFDQIILIAPHRIPEFRKGLLENQFPAENLLEFTTLTQAQEWLNQHLQSGDIVLYENDLPDLYESRKAFSLI